MTAGPFLNLAVTLRVMQLQALPSDALSSALAHWLQHPTTYPPVDITIEAIEHLLLARGEGKALLPAPWYPGSVAETK